MKRPRNKAKLKLLQLQLFGSVGLFILAAYLAKDSLWPIEETIFSAVYGLPDWLEIFFLAITQLGGITMLFVLAAIFLIKKHYSLVIRLLMSGTLAYLMAGVAKEILGRARPGEFLADVIYRDQLVHGAGFPSGHMALATAVALTIGRYIPKKYWWAAPAVIIGVGLSRIYLGVHAPLDLIGGFAIGWFAAEIFRTVRLTDMR